MNKKINNIMLGLGILIMLLVQLQSALAASALTVTLSKYEPFPATPGQTVKVWLLVQNTGTYSATNVGVKLISQYPFTLYGDINDTKTIPLLSAGSDYLIDYTLKVDQNAVEGDNVLTVKLFYNSGGTASEADTDIDLNVQTKDATVSIDSVKMDPAEIEPGSDGVLTITVKNVAPTTMTDLSLKLYLQAQVGGTIIDLPFAPMDSNAEKKINNLDPGQNAAFTFKLRAYPDAVSKVYKIPFSLIYYDNLGNQKNKSDFVGVVVNSVPDISIYVDKTDLLQQKKSGTVTLKIVNKGLSDIKFLNVIIQKSQDFDLLSNSDTTYVGNLVSDDYQSVDYKIDIKSAGNDIILPIDLQYRDANNNLYDKVVDVDLKLIDSSKLNTANNAGSSITLVVVILIIIAVVVIIIVRRRNKKSKKAQFG